LNSLLVPDILTTRLRVSMLLELQSNSGHQYWTIIILYTRMSSRPARTTCF